MFQSWYQTKTQDEGAGCVGSGRGAWWAFLASGSPGLPAWVSSAPEARSGGGNRDLGCAAAFQPLPDLLPLAPARGQLRL